MAELKRDSGIDLLGNISWGTHFCLFYETREDLSEILVPYFKAGLSNNEFCIWITSEPLNKADAKEFMKEAIPEFDAYIRTGQIEIIPSDEWYLINNTFDYHKVLNGWMEKLEKALARGYNGLRMTGNAFWLEKIDIRDDFARYEKEINTIIGNFKMIAICPYSLAQCSVNEILDVVNTHQLALIKYKGSWRLIESAELKATKQALQVEIVEHRRVEEALRLVRDDLEIRVQERIKEIRKTTTELGAGKELQKIAEAQNLAQAALLDQAQDEIFLMDLKYNIIYLNKSAQHAHISISNEIEGKNVDELFAPDPSSQLKDARKQVEAQGGWLGELHQMTKEGKTIIVQSRWTLVKDKEGKPKSIMMINTDITEQKKFENELYRSQRIESINTLAGGIAHDLNNVLSPILMSVNLLKKKLKDEQSLKVLSILERNSWRGANLIKQLMLFARGAEGKHVDLQITSVIGEIEKIVTETFPKYIKFIIEVADNIFTISGDDTQLHQVLINLCVNARDAMPNGGTLHISAENVYIDENFVRTHSGAKIGPYITMTVSDTGIGMTPETQERLFEPFFTTKGIGKGTGLGLSIVQGIVKSHGGFITVFSEYGEGATFKVYLPAIQKESVQTVQEAQEKLPKGNGELVLVVDDEPEILEIFKAALEEYGYKVLTASDGAESVAIYLQHAKEISVIIIDMMMPIMDGASVIRALRKINPYVKIIASSGLLEHGKLKKDSIDSQAFLNKPCTAEQLLETLHQVLNKK